MGVRGRLRSGEQHLITGALVSRMWHLPVLGAPGWLLAKVGTRCVGIVPALKGHTLCGHLDPGQVTETKCGDRGNPGTPQGVVCCVGESGGGSPS